MHWIIAAMYIVFLSFILVFSLSQANNTLIYLFKRKKHINQELDPSNLPVVTVQLPIYNEKYVIIRLVDAITAIDYPRDLLEIQILDDSTDETVPLARDIVEEYKSEGFDITHIRRQDRKDYKAGALKYGMEISKGEFIAIFDADFLPKPDFLKKTLSYFQDEKVGVVQARWGHINEDYSLLTKLQSFALNAHFTIEQTARNVNSHFINFNGTAGIWRKETIDDAGGWEGDTLTEDLDLSYRAQLKGWVFKYLEDVVTPAELPAEMNAVKSQQFRWSKGAAECMRKNLGKVMKAKHLKPSTKIHAFFHLTNSFIWVCMLFAAILLLPIQYCINQYAEMSVLLGFLSIFQISFFLLLFFYFTANIVANQNCPWWKCVLILFAYPVFITFSMGISIYNAIGVIEGYIGKKSPFVRTPKFNIVDQKDSFKKKSYVKWNLNSISVIELICLVYFSISAYFTYQLENYHALAFILMMVAGIGIVFCLSAFHHYKANRAAA